MCIRDSKITALSEIRKKVFEEIKLSSPQIGEYFSIGEIEKIINNIKIVSRVNSVQIIHKEGKNYSENRYSIKSNLSRDGGLIFIPQDCIWEVKFEKDITGKIQ